MQDFKTRLEAARVQLLPRRKFAFSSKKVHGSCILCLLSEPTLPTVPAAALASIRPMPASLGLETTIVTQGTQGRHHQLFCSLPLTQRVGGVFSQESAHTHSG